MATVNIRTVPACQARQVLRLTLAARGQSAGDLERQVTGFIRYAREMSLDLGRQWLCTADDGTVTGCTVIVSPGRSALLILPPGDTVGKRADLTPDLIQHVIRHGNLTGVRLVQCLIETEDHRTLTALKSTGFKEIATLLYMERSTSVEAPLPEAAIPAAVAERCATWVTYDATTHDEFARLLVATYEDSLDCPGLSGLRDIEDVMAGYKAAGRFLPHRWILLRLDGSPAGCILFAENPLQPSLELVYMGVHPAFRRMGVGRCVLLRGLCVADRERFSTVTLAVDVKNAPALALYRGAGFRRLYARRALIRLLDSTASQP